MLCASCKKDFTWVNMIGSDMVCNRCIVKNTVLKEVNRGDESRLRQIIRDLKPKDFKELCSYTDEMLEGKKIINKNK